MINKLRLLTQKDNTKSLTIQLIIPIILFSVFRLVYIELLKPGEAAYFQDVISFAIIKSPGFIVLILINIYLLINFRSLNWQKNNLDFNLKIFLFIIALTIGWAFSTYDFNLYFNREHLIDRIILLTLPFFILFHPLFVIPFIIFSIPVVAQFELPLKQFSWTDKKVLFYILILFNVYLYSRLILKKDYRVYVILALIMIACSYFYAGFAKLKINWLFINELQNLFVSSYVNGWLGFLEQSTALHIAEKIRSVNFLLLLATLVIELGALLILKSKRYCILILILFCMFHTGIFIASGILFWKWVVLNIAALYLITQLSKDDLNFIFNPELKWIYIFLIIITVLSFRPTRLGWFDTNLNNIYRIEAEGISGRIYEFDTNFFSPYDFPFTQNRFYFLNKEKILVRTYGSTENKNIFYAIKNIDSQEELMQLEKKMGKNYYDPEKKKIFKKFLKTFFRNLNKRMSKNAFLTSIAAPKHKITFGEVNQVNEMLSEIKVFSEKIIYKENKIILLERKNVLTICLVEDLC